MCSLFSVGSRTSTGQVSSTVCAGMRAAAKTPLPGFDRVSSWLRIPGYRREKCWARLKLGTYRQAKPMLS